MFGTGLEPTRRDFLKTTALAGAGLALGVTPAAAGAEDKPLPKRVLGRTKAEVTILGLGTAPIGEARNTWSPPSGSCHFLSPVFGTRHVMTLPSSSRA